TGNPMTDEQPTTPWESLGPGIYEDIPEDVYHADPCESPSLSSSLSRVVLNQSAQHAWHLHPRLGGKRRMAGKAALEGQLLHAIALGQPLPNGVVVVECKDFKAKAARDERDALKEDGKTPI